MHIDDHEKAGRLIKYRENGIRLREGARGGSIDAKVYHGGTVDVFSVIAAEPIRSAIAAEAEVLIKDIEMQLADIGVTVVKPAPVTSKPEGA